MGCDLGFNGGGWPIWVVVGLVIFGLQFGFRCVGLMFRWLRFGLVVFGLLAICMYFARRLLVVGLSWVCSPWVWLCSLWVWFLFAMGLGFVSVSQTYFGTKPKKKILFFLKPPNLNTKSLEPPQQT